MFKSKRSSALRLALLASCCLIFATACRRDMQDQPRYEYAEHSDFFADGLSSRPLVEGTVPRGYLREDAQLYTGKKTGGGTRIGAVNALQGTGADISGGGGNTAGGEPSQGVRGASSNTSTAAAPGNATLNSPPNTAPAAGSFDPSLADTFPFPVTQEVLSRGQERYQIFCSMCHGATGKGDGMVVRRGYRQPPSYHTEQLRTAPVGHFFDVITNGWGAMPNYAAQVPVRDRWAIVAYIRALQLSREGTAADLPAQSQPQGGGSGSREAGEHGGGGHE